VGSPKLGESRLRNRINSAAQPVLPQFALGNELGVLDRGRKHKTVQSRGHRLDVVHDSVLRTDAPLLRLSEAAAAGRSAGDSCRPIGHASRVSAETAQDWRGSLGSPLE
jgi:hypothetical protein